MQMCDQILEYELSATLVQVGSIFIEIYKGRCNLRVRRNISESEQIRRNDFRLLWVLWVNWVSYEHIGEL
jgi:hypothetical protein